MFKYILQFRVTFFHFCVQGKYQKSVHVDINILLLYEVR